MLALRQMNFRLPNDMTVTELLAQHGQDADLTQKLWEPLCIAALNTPIQKASAQVLLNVLRDALNKSRAYSDMLLPRVDFTALFPQRAASYVEQHGGNVLFSCGVEALRPIEDGIEITSARGTENFSHVVCAAPPTVAAKLLRPIARTCGNCRTDRQPGTPADLHRVSAIPHSRHPAPPDARPAPTLQPVAIRQGTHSRSARPARRRDQRGRHPPGIVPG